MNTADVTLISKTGRKPKRRGNFISAVNNCFAKFDGGFQIQFSLNVLCCLLDKGYTLDTKLSLNTLLIFSIT